MISLSAAQQAAVDGPATLPQFLVEIQLEQSHYYSTRAERAYNGNTFIPGHVRLGRVTPDRAELWINNADYIHTDNALDGVYMRNSVKIWWAYDAAHAPRYVQKGYWQAGYTAEPDDTEPAPLLRFEGIISATPEIDNWISIVAERTPPRRYPFARLRPPFANHLPSVGYTLQFDSQVLRIEGK